MHITQHTDYALRVLIHVGGNPGRLVTIAEIAETFDVSRSHMMKVVNQLVREGFIEGLRGKGGGLRLARPAAEIGVGDVARRMESDFKLVECFGGGGNCLLAPGCQLQTALIEALQAFMAVLDRYTLADLLGTPSAQRVIRLVPAVAAPTRAAAASIRSPATGSAVTRSTTTR